MVWTELGMVMVKLVEPLPLCQIAVKARKSEIMKLELRGLGGLSSFQF
jgi:hypothetical protein